MNTSEESWIKINASVLAAFDFGWFLHRLTIEGQSVI